MRDQALLGLVDLIDVSIFALLAKNRINCINCINRMTYVSLNTEYSSPRPYYGPRDVVLTKSFSGIDTGSRIHSSIDTAASANAIRRSNRLVSRRGLSSSSHREDRGVVRFLDRNEDDGCNRERRTVVAAVFEDAGPDLVVATAVFARLDGSLA